MGPTERLEQGAIRASLARAAQPEQSPSARTPKFAEEMGRREVERFQHTIHTDPETVIDVPEDETTVFTRTVLEGMQEGVITEEQVLALDGIRQAHHRETRLGDPLE